jgi:hypothetical protein
MRDTAKYMARTKTTPCGFPFEGLAALWRHEREVSCGMYYRWRDIPPQSWLGPRMWVSEFLNHWIDTHRYDTPLQVYNAVDAGDIEDSGAVAAWRKVEDSYTPDLVPVWICDSTLNFCADWLRTEQGIVWVSHTAFGERLSERTGVPFFHDSGCAPSGIHIEQHRGPAIASVGSCATGHNLQHHQRNLITACPSPGELEQLISRTHRDGQKHPVYVEFLCRLSGDRAAVDKALEDAHAINTQFQVVQRVTYAEWE